MSFVEFPIFDGVPDQLRSWLSWIEEFFVREDFTGDEKLNLAQSLLEGEALIWLRRRQSWWFFQRWEGLKDAMLLKFGDDDDPEKIKIILEHQREWEKLKSRVTISGENNETVSLKEESNQEEEITKLKQESKNVMMNENQEEESNQETESQKTTKSTLATVFVHRTTSTSHLQVSIPSWEHSHRIHNEIVDVLADLPSVFVRKKKKRWKMKPVIPESPSRDARSRDPRDRDAPVPEMPDTREPEIPRSISASSRDPRDPAIPEIPRSRDLARDPETEILHSEIQWKGLLRLFGSRLFCQLSSELVSSGLLSVNSAPSSSSLRISSLLPIQFGARLFVSPRPTQSAPSISSLRRNPPLLLLPELGKLG